MKNNYDTFQNLLITGGAGFIGSNMIRYLLGPESGFTGRIINVDSLTYAGNPESLSDISKAHGEENTGRYIFFKTDICDRPSIKALFKTYDIDSVCHLAAESHVDRSILGPETFITTNIMRTFTILAMSLGNVRKAFWVSRISEGVDIYNSSGKAWFGAE